jgi:hypothetical protein
MINGSLITDNGKGITQFSRDMRSSNNLFHWVMQDNTVERNAAGGFHVSLPYVWQYNENFTHSLFLANNTFRGNKDFRYNSVNINEKSYFYCKVTSCTCVISK